MANPQVKNDNVVKIWNHFPPEKEVSLFERHPDTGMTLDVDLLNDKITYRQRKFDGVSPVVVSKPEAFDILRQYQVFCQLMKKNDLESVAQAVVIADTYLPDKLVRAAGKAYDLALRREVIENASQMTDLKSLEKAVEFAEKNLSRNEAEVVRGYFDRAYCNATFDELLEYEAGITLPRDDTEVMKELRGPLTPEEIHEINADAEMKRAHEKLDKKLRKHVEYEKIDGSGFWSRLKSYFTRPF